MDWSNSLQEIVYSYLKITPELQEDSVHFCDWAVISSIYAVINVNAVEIIPNLFTNNRPSSPPFISILELINQRKITYEYMEPIYIGYR